MRNAYARSSRSHEPQRKSAPQIRIGRCSLWLSQNLVDRDLPIGDERRRAGKRSGSVSFIVMGGRDSCRPCVQSQNQQLDIGVIRRAGQQIGSFACRAADESRVDSCEQLRYTGFAISGSCHAAPDLGDQLESHRALYPRIPVFLSG